jgi:hypothetical protein
MHSHVKEAPRILLLVLTSFPLPSFSLPSSPSLTTPPRFFYQWLIVTIHPPIQKVRLFMYARDPNKLRKWICLSVIPVFKSISLCRTQNSYFKTSRMNSSFFPWAQPGSNIEILTESQLGLWLWGRERRELGDRGRTKRKTDDTSQMLILITLLWSLPSMPGT